MKTSKTTAFATLMGSASVLVLGMIAMSATAQDAAPAAPVADESTVVVVTGQRAQLKSAQKIKKDSETVVDSITATDIGALPDRSVSEALQRVVGVTLQRTNEAHDPARLSGEGGAVFVRGLSYVTTLVNGREVFGASNGRTIGFEDVSADLMAGVDVYKATVADQVEGALGGTVNLRTRLPFDSKKRIIAFTLDGNYGDLREKPYYSGSLTYSDRWTTGAGELGLLLNYSQSNIGTRSNSNSVDRFDSVATGKYVPKAMGFRTIDWSQKREAVAVAAQWRPNDDLEFTLQYLNTKANPLNLERASGISDNLLVNNPSYTYDSNGNFTSGIVNDTALYNDTRSGDDHKETTDASLAFRYNVSPKLVLTGDVQSVSSTAKIISFTVGATSFGSGLSDVAVDLRGNLPTFTFYQTNFFDGTATTDANKKLNTGLADPANYYYSFAMDHLEDNEATDGTAHIDMTYSFDSDWLKSLKVGGRVTDKHSITRENGYNWGAVSQDAQWAGNTVNNDSPLPHADYYGFPGFFHGDSAATPSFFPTASLTDYYASRDKLAQAASDLGWGWVPFDGNYAGAGYGRADNVASGVIDQTEKTKAIYGVVRFGHDNFLGSDKTIDGNIGVRVVKTELQNGTGQIIYPSAIAQDGTTIIDPTLTGTARQQYVDAFTIANTGGGQSGVKVNNSYTDTLPSVNLRLHWNSQLQFRISASQAIVRPTFSQMSPFTTLGISTTAVNSNPPVFAPNPQGGPDVLVKYYNSVSYTGSGGNPGLKPMEANAYDFSAEWYFSPTTSVTLALFKKDLKNYFVGSTGDETYTIGGISKTYSVFRTRNGDKGSIDGFELAYQQFYDFLPGPLSGIGIQANMTRVNSTGGANTPVGVSDPNSVAGAGNSSLPQEGLSKNAYNVAVMYEKYGISGRLAYNWRSQYLLTTSAANVNAPVWSEDYGQLDGSIFYDLPRGLKIGIQATNLTQAKTYLQVGYPDRLNRVNWFDTDRRVALVLRGVF